VTTETRTTESAAAGAPAAGDGVGDKTLPNPDHHSPNERKIYWPQRRPFHRLRSPNYDLAVEKPGQQPKVPASGRGYDCGCRRPDDYAQGGIFKKLVRYAWEKFKERVLLNNPVAARAYQELRAKILAETGHDIEEETAGWIIDTLCNMIEVGIFGSYMRSIPSWVPVNRKRYGPDFDPDNAHNVIEALGPDGKPRLQEREVEVEGELTRSYFTRHHRVYTQWNRFYPWSFQVTPAPGYRYLLGLGNVKSPADLEALKNGRSEVTHLYGPDLALKPSLECLLDVGAFAKAPGDHPAYHPLRIPSPIFDQKWPFWPQSGDWFWASGRYVYDCTHTTSDENVEVPIGLHPTMLHPVKAFAVARYEGFRFEQQPDTPVPAIRFMFFATRRGGYYDFDGDIKPTDRDYEFAVDLPPLPDEYGEHAVGRTPQYMLNSIVVRPRLLRHIAFGPFKTETTRKWWEMDPLIQLTRPTPGKLPRMAKITVPMSKMPDDCDVYCFVVTLGWYSPEASSRVKKVTVQLPRFINRSSNEDYIRLNVCINGRLIYYPLDKAKTNEPFANVRDSMQGWPPDNGLELEVPDDGFLAITAHGSHRHGYGEYMEKNPAFDKQDPVNGHNDRRLRFGAIIEVPKEIIEGARQALLAFLAHFPKDLMDETLHEMLSDQEIQNALLGSVFGERRIVEWKRDVDAETPTVAAVAREMKMLPFGPLTKPNDPMGLIDRPTTGQRGTDSRVYFRVTELLSAGATATKPFEITYEATETKQIADTGFVYFAENEGRAQDYTLACSVKVGDPDAPPASSK